jgi:hypothetical protein
LYVSELFISTGTLCDDSQHQKRLVQQEQLLEEISRKNAEKIAALSISERTKRAMLAEVVEDEIFTVSQQIVDLVLQNEAQSVVEKYDEVMKELNYRNFFLQQQYNDLVTGRPSSLLLSVDSVTDDRSTGLEGRPGSLNDNEFK